MVGVVQRRLRENHSHASQVGRSKYVELGGLALEVNHPCDPNCGVRVNQSGAYDLIARRAIRPGEEITFDYAMRNYSVEHFPSRCRCGTPSCRGVVKGWKDLSDERKAAYTGLVAPYLLAMDHGVERDARGSWHTTPRGHPCCLTLLVVLAAVGIGVAANFLKSRDEGEDGTEGASVLNVLNATALLAGLLVAIVLADASGSYSAARSAAKSEADTMDSLYEPAEYVELPARQAIQAAVVC